MGNFSSKKNTVKGAGCLFTDGKYVIAGLQPFKKPVSISGLGGKTTVGESIIETALRETLEELFEMHIQPSSIIDELKMIKPRAVYNVCGYTNHIYTFSDLLRFLETIYKNGYKSRLYAEFPLTIEDLVSKRLLIPECEISHLVLLPVVRGLAIDRLFVQDINAVIDLKSFIFIDTK